MGRIAGGGPGVWTRDSSTVWRKYYGLTDALLYRKEMLDEIGGFDEDFFAYADDAELGLRARIAGWTCVYTPQAVARHHRGNTSGVASVGRFEAD